jgi:hypothetical protein
MDLDPGGNLIAGLDPEHWPDVLFLFVASPLPLIQGQRLGKEQSIRCYCVRRGDNITGAAVPALRIWIWMDLYHAFELLDPDLIVKITLKFCKNINENILVMLFFPLFEFFFAW